MSQDKKDILKALEEMEQKSQAINERKDREQARIKKHIKPKVEISREEIIKKKAEHQDLDARWTFRTRLTAGALVLTGILIWMYKKSGGGSEFVFYVIAGLIFFGFYLMALVGKK